MLLTNFFKTICFILVFCGHHYQLEAKTKKSKIEVIFAVVESCHDGDTCKVKVEKIPLDKSEIYKIRLSGIDAPEIKQVDGVKAKNFLELLVLKKKVKLNCTGRSFDRKTCEMFLDDLSINAEMVKNGWAWDSAKHSKGIYKKFEKSARYSQLGLWRQKNIISPYCFRHKKKKQCKTNAQYME